MTDVTLKDRKAFCQPGSGFTAAYVRERPLRSKRKLLNRGGMEEECRPGSGTIPSPLYQAKCITMRPAFMRLTSSLIPAPFLFRSSSFLN